MNSLVISFKKFDGTYYSLNECDFSLELHKTLTMQMKVLQNNATLGFST